MEIMQNKVFLGAILVCGIVWGINGYIAVHRVSALFTKSESGIESNIYKFPTVNPPSSTSGWKAYTYGGFSLQLPQDWHESSFSTSTGPWLFYNGEPSNGLGIPKSGYMWIEVAKVDGLKTFCTGTTMGYETQSFSDVADLRERIICTNNYQISLGLWQSDPNKDTHEQFLNQIVSSFDSSKVI